MNGRSCAFDGCQAGGVILAGAPRYVSWSNDEYHPGCWAAESLRIGEAIGRRLDSLAPTPPPVPAAIFVEGRP